MRRSRMIPGWRRATMAGWGLALGLVAAPTVAQPVRKFANPPVALPEGMRQKIRTRFLDLKSQKIGLAELPDDRDTISYTFDIQETEGKLFNPWTGQDDKVRLRSFRGNQVDPEVPFMAPTITMRPGHNGFQLNVPVKLALLGLEEELCPGPIRWTCVSARLRPTGVVAEPWRRWPLNSV